VVNILKIDFLLLVVISANCCSYMRLNHSIKIVSFEGDKHDADTSEELDVPRDEKTYGDNR
jgi:hypothetical protein